MDDFRQRISKLSPAKLAILAQRLQQKVESLERAAHEPIAVIGIGCRMPGGVKRPGDLWRLMQDGVDAISEVPPDRWDVDSLYNPDPDVPGRVTTRWGGFIEDPYLFDARFFGISPREAPAMDPQQRWILETAWEALEYAGINPESLDGSSAGVYVGMCTGDYGQILLSGPRDTFDLYVAAGNARSVSAGRISYLLGLHGPSIAVDTSCSSALVAVDLACRSLRDGRCSLTLAGAVNLMLTPDTTVAMSRGHMMASDGRCKGFAASADGFVRGEGCGMVVLKRLQDAIRDGDNVLAVIRGVATNQDGRSSGLTAPNGVSQEAVIREALTDAGIEPAQVSYVETHGTGTQLGDPIEARALANVFKEGRPAGHKLAIGSVKSNIGHLEAAAGIAGLIKVILALQHREIPPHLHLNALNPNIEWSEMPIVIPTERTEWQPIGGRWVAGVSSFGFSGTNAHLVVESGPEAPAAAGTVRPLHLLTVSAKTESALRTQAANYAEALETNLPALVDAAFTGNTGRAHFEHRLAVIAETSQDAAVRLREFAAGTAGSGIIRGQVSRTAPELAFLFTGRGGEYAGMGRELFETCPVFRSSMERCAQLLEPLLDRPLLEALYPPEDGQAPALEAALAEAALFATEYALLELWLSWGVEPAAVMGDGVGEYAAACAAGVISLEDSLALIACRSHLFANPADGPQSPLMEGAYEDFERRLSEVSFGDPEFGIISSLTGELVDDRTMSRPEYWLSQLRQPVQFTKGMATLERLEYRFFVEIGPHPALTETARAALHDPAQLVPSLRRGEQDWRQMLDSLARVYAAGVPVDWRGFDRAYPRRKVVLPTYPFERESYRISEPAAPAARAVPAKAAEEGVLYGIQWRPRPLAASMQAPAPGARWLLFADRDGIAHELELRLRAAQGKVTLVHRGSEFARLSDTRVQIDPANRGHYERLIEPLSSDGEPPLQGVVYLWGLDWPAGRKVSSTALTRYHSAACRGLLNLLQALAVTKGADSTGLWVVTRGSQPVDGAAVEVAPAPLWGMTRGIISEECMAHASLIDLDPAAARVDGLWEELFAENTESQVAFRGGLRSRPQAAPLEQPARGGHNRLLSRGDPPGHGRDRRVGPVCT